ncbi:hypothetical protein INP83_11500 [Mucilaginibacter sp. 21P]|uniref:hypothetical protein n=1 Tax=Mucilaginibacter sp. 21P TaxID=2778902 RepID=UPI001C57DD14|nr:hypothetical protein [Mucilaginibacter sp. 21P]QXV63732.1 hypothetical protein INP83_11500 [Mucilaginibacter sp. 21P]
MIRIHNKSFDQWEIDINKATPEEIKDKQALALWNGFGKVTISSIIYKEFLRGNKLQDQFYQAHIAILNDEVEKAEIR